MNRFTTIIKYDYLQRTRSYRFLITLCFSLAFAYSFIPAPSASYTTITIGDYLGNYNSAWIAYVSAIMTSVFLSLTGYYLINNSLKNDIDTKLGQIIATTRISNFTYLLSKVISNFLVLLTIVLIIFVMSILLFFLYSTDTRLVLSDFVIAYLLIPIPTIFFISVIAIVLEMFLTGKSIIQNLVFFFLFCMMLVGSSNEKQRFPVDLFGKNNVTEGMTQQVKRISAGEDHHLNIGFVIGRQEEIKRFNFEGTNFPFSYILMRLLLIIIGIGLIAIINPFFHRFNIKEELRTKKIDDDTSNNDKAKEIIMSQLPTAKPAFGIIPFYKTELLLMIRKGKKCLWGVNLIGMILLAFIPINVAHTIALPILWFLQVSRWASLTTKEKEYNVHYFAFSSFRPLSRLLTAQLLAGVTISVTLALPLILRHAVQLSYNELLAIFLGAIFIVLFSAFLGIVTQGKKLFEILFFLITYANINSVPFMDYFGGLSSSNSYLMIMSVFILIMTFVSYSIRKYELSRL